MSLTKTEARLFVILANTPGRIHSHRELIKRLWGGYATHAALRNLVRHIRNKVGYDAIETVHGVGYKMRKEEA